MNFVIFDFINIIFISSFNSFINFLFIRKYFIWKNIKKYKLNIKNNVLFYS